MKKKNFLLSISVHKLFIVRPGSTLDNSVLCFCFSSFRFICLFVCFIVELYEFIKTLNCDVNWTSSYHIGICTGSHTHLSIYWLHFLFHSHCLFPFQFSFRVSAFYSVQSIWNLSILKSTSSILSPTSFYFLTSAESMKWQRKEESESLCEWNKNVGVNKIWTNSVRMCTHFH